VAGEEKDPGVKKNRCRNMSRDEPGKINDRQHFFVAHGLFRAPERAPLFFVIRVPEKGSPFNDRPFGR
jgi:hypothetical protein